MRHLIFVVLAVITPADWVRLFREALQHAHCTDKEAYGDMGISQSQFSKQMSGVEPPRFLFRLGRIKNLEVVKWLGLLIAGHVGQPHDIKRGIPVVLAMASHRRMLRITQITRRQLAARKETA